MTSDLDLSTLSVFQHGIASGDPLQDRVIIWTRVTPQDDEPVNVMWKVAYDRDFNCMMACGMAFATANTDFTVHVDVENLDPGTYYFYQFTALDQRSQVGRTKTLPSANIDQVRFAQVSCAKFNAGYFNAYARIAEREDLDLLLHLGDYIYEAANTPPASQTPAADIGRHFEPPHECKNLADYRQRHAQYHTDPDVQAMHAALPIVATLDDHELADGAWRGGASEHKPERDGAWMTRLGQALQARREWLPIRLPDPANPLRTYRSMKLGNLAELFLIDTRTYRDEPVPPPAMHNAARTALGPAQKAWLGSAFHRSTSAWRLIGNPSVFAITWANDLPDSVVRAMAKLKLIDGDGTGPDYDQWDGYPAERDWLLNLMRQHPMGNTVVLSGDVHVSLAIELQDASGAPVAVEFVNPSLTSQNLDDKMGWTPRTASLAIEDTVSEALPHLKWCDLDSHGYAIIDVTRERVQAEWWAVETVLRRSPAQYRVAAWQVESGSPQLTEVEDCNIEIMVSELELA
jgi:alkaline phosphatase D